MISGIYKIKNILNEKYYIGSSHDIENRWEVHKYRLNCGGHINIYLQRAWNIDGEYNFELEIIRQCDGYTKPELLSLEQWYLDRLDEKAYNLSKRASGGDLIS